MQSIDNRGSDIQYRHDHQTGTAKRILIVDDERELAELGQLILSHHGYKVIACYDGQQALALLRKAPFDLVIADVVMPGMSGYELSCEVLSLYPDIKFQLVSGYTGERFVPKQHQQLHEQLLRKPYKSSALLQRVRELLTPD